MMPARDAELWRTILDHRLLDVHTAMPAEVKSFDAVAQTVDVQPLIKHVVQALDGTETVESYPELRAVPIQYPRAGGFVMCWPLSVGDPVTVLFHEWSLDNYLEKGREDHPIDVGRHGAGARAGAAVLPIGPYQASDTIGETIDALMVGYDGGAMIRIADDGTIRIASTAGAVQAVALADDTKAEISALRDTVNSLVSAYNGHTHTGTTASACTAGGATGTCVVTSTPSTGSAPAAVGDIGSTKVEVEE